jgi:hypothetical protein
MFRMLVIVETGVSAVTLYRLSQHVGHGFLTARPQPLPVNNVVLMRQDFLRGCEDCNWLKILLEYNSSLFASSA